MNNNWCFLFFAFVFISCNNPSADSTNSKEVLLCDEDWTEAQYKGNSVMLKSCTNKEMQTTLAFYPNSDTAYKINLFEGNIKKIWHYKENKPFRISIELEAGGKYSVNQSYFNINGQWVDSSMISWSTNSNAVEVNFNQMSIHLGERILKLDSAVLLGYFDRYLNIQDANKIFLENVRLQPRLYQNKILSLNIPHQKSAIFLVFVSVEGKEGHGGIPFYLNQKLIDLAAKSGNVYSGKGK